MKSRLEVLPEFFARYARAFLAVWRMRGQLDGPQLSAEERAFLPAHLELLESPAHPAARWSMRAIVALLAIAFLWAAIGEVDVVAVAPGKAVVGSRTKTLQAAETAVVRRILVRDGEMVRAGQLLIELDPTAPDADLARTNDALIDARLTEMRMGAVLSAIDGRRMDRIHPEGVPAARLAAAREHLKGEIADYRARRAALLAVLEQRRAELASATAAVPATASAAQIASKRAGDYRLLAEKGYVGRHEYLALEQQRIDAHRELAAQRGRATELVRAVQGARSEVAAFEANARQSAHDALATAQSRIRELQPEARKAAARSRLWRLRSPVAGTVQQLAIHTVGGVVTPAQPLLAIVPSNETLEVEATVLNKDIGFVRPGQRATVKIEAFPYTRYGYLEGKVESVSSDAAQDDRLGLVFPARVKLDRAVIRVGDRLVPITPGMALSVEIQTARRTVLDFLLSPVQQYQQESFRER